MNANLHPQNKSQHLDQHLVVSRRRTDDLGFALAVAGILAAISALAFGFLSVSLKAQAYAPSLMIVSAILLTGAAIVHTLYRGRS